MDSLIRGKIKWLIEGHIKPLTGGLLGNETVSSTGRLGYQVCLMEWYGYCVPIGYIYYWTTHCMYSYMYMYFELDMLVLFVSEGLAVYDVICHM